MTTKKMTRQEEHDFYADAPIACAEVATVEDDRQPDIGPVRFAGHRQRDGRRLTVWRVGS